MKKVSFLLLALFIAISCNEDNEVIDAPNSIESTRWFKEFNKSEVESASGGTAQGRVNRMQLTFVMTSDTDFRLDSYTVTTTQGSFSKTFYGTYEYNSSNGVVAFKYNNTNLFGSGSDKGTINGNRMTLGGKYIFEKQ